MMRLSRLLPDPSNPRRRHRDMSLESLESRVVMTGNIAVVYDRMTETLAITRDTPGDIFTIQEHSIGHGGAVTVTAAATPQKVSSQSISPMMIDGSQTPGGFTTPGPVKNITLNLPGDSLTPTTVNLLGEGKDVPTMVQNVTVNLPSVSQPHPMPSLRVNVGGSAGASTAASGVNISGAVDHQSNGDGLHRWRACGRYRQQHVRVGGDPPDRPGRCRDGRG